MPKTKQPSSKQLLSVIQTQTAIAKLGLDINAVMTLVAEQIQTITQAKGAIVELAEDGDMVYRAVSNGANDFLGLRLKMDSSLSGLCIAQNTTLYCKDSEVDERVDRDACRRVGLRSMAVVPLIHCDEPIGVLKIYSERVNAFKDSDINLLSLMSELIAAAMYHATKYGAQELYKLATQDNLTGLANRALFLDCLRQGVDKAKRAGLLLGILMIDMDGLKPINDQYGHSMGDQVLTQVARCLASNVRDQYIIGRFGGEEFLLLLPNTPTIQAQNVAERCRHAVSQLRFITEYKQEFSVSASFGISSSLSADEPHLIISQADQALYAVKAAGRNQVKIFTDLATS